MFPGGSISSCWQTPAMPAASQSQEPLPTPWEASGELSQTGSVRASSSWSVGAQPTSFSRGSKMAVGSHAVLSPRLTSDEAASLVATGAPKHAAAVRLTASETILPTARLAALKSQPVPQSAGFRATERQVESLFTGPGGSSSGSSLGDLADAVGVSNPAVKSRGFDTLSSLCMFNPGGGGTVVHWGCLHLNKARLCDPSCSALGLCAPQKARLCDQVTHGG